MSTHLAWKNRQTFNAAQRAYDNAAPEDTEVVCPKCHCVIPEDRGCDEADGWCVSCSIEYGAATVECCECGATWDLNESQTDYGNRVICKKCGADAVSVNVG